MDAGALLQVRSAGVQWTSGQARLCATASAAVLFSFVQSRQLLLQILELGHVVDDDVGLIRMIDEIILVVGLGLIERFERSNLSHNGSLKHFGLVQLIYVSLGYAFLLI